MISHPRGIGKQVTVFPKTSNSVFGEGNDMAPNTLRSLPVVKKGRECYDARKSNGTLKVASVARNGSCPNHCTVLMWYP